MVTHRRMPRGMAGMPNRLPTNLPCRMVPSRKLSSSNNSRLLAKSQKSQESGPPQVAVLHLHGKLLHVRVYMYIDGHRRHCYHLSTAKATKALSACRPALEPSSSHQRAKAPGQDFSCQRISVGKDLTNDPLHVVDEVLPCLGASSSNRVAPRWMADMGMANRRRSSSSCLGFGFGTARVEQCFQTIIHSLRPLVEPSSSR